MNTNGLSRRFSNHLSFEVWQERLMNDVNAILEASGVPKGKRYGHPAHMYHALRKSFPGFEWPVPFQLVDLMRFREHLVARKINGQPKMRSDPVEEV